MNAQFPDLLESPSIQMLDQAILALSKEFWFRTEDLVQCKFYSCLDAVFKELLDTLMDQREELLRHPSTAAAAAVYMGEDEESEADAEDEENA
jgi:hypothetical protein